ncbi:MAG TPA: hypothetical protein VFX17_00520 [Patescibacteria group bacterium]|nr:hypothetical protein [Patescibacteria group bacterium]
MWKLLLFCSCPLLAYWAYASKRAQDEAMATQIRECEALILCHDMTSKISELADDPDITESTWREWLPVVEAADAEISAKCPRLEMASIADLVYAVVAH